MGLSYGLVNLMYSMLYSEHWRIKGSRSNKRRKLLTCFTNSLFKVYNNLSCRETRPEVYNNRQEPLSDTDTTSSTDQELFASDNLRCSQPSSQPSACTSTAPPSRLQTYSSEQRRLQVTRRTKGTVEDTALFNSTPFAEQCYHIIQYMRSPEIDTTLTILITNMQGRILKEKLKDINGMR